MAKKRGGPAMGFIAEACVSSALSKPVSPVPSLIGLPVSCACSGISPPE